MSERLKADPIVKMAPAYKDYLWGGSRLKEQFNKESDMSIIAESWELSAHPDGESRISDGEYTDFTLSEYLEAVGKDVLGNKAQNFEKFPLLIKFIDANKPLSLQVHPDDEYALNYEGEYGKNEMWYIADAQPGAYIYYGLSREVSKEEIRRRIKEESLEEVLNKIEVKPGDTFYVKAGTIHAIGSGSLICEIQQSSNSTYRIYDYGRRDKEGNLRPLHIDKALDVIDVDLNLQAAKEGALQGEKMPGNFIKLVESPYFTTNLYKGNSASVIKVDESSFVALVVLKGEGELFASDGNQVHRYKPGDTFFVDAGNREIMINGATEFLIVRI